MAAKIENTDGYKEIDYLYMITTIAFLFVGIGMYLIGGVAETIITGMALFCIIVCCILQLKDIINYN